MSGAAVLPSLIPLFVVLAMRRAEARIHRQLSEARAFTAESAVDLSLSRSMEKRRLAGLIGSGAVRLAANGRHFLDADGWSRYQGRRRQRVLLVVSALVALIGIAVGLLLVMQ